MTLGTKTVLFGFHQFLIHPIIVTIAWIRLYKSLPTFKEFICICLHDIGYIGKNDIKGEEGDRHPELGARIANRLLGPKYRDFILGHSTYYIYRHRVKRSKLLSADKFIFVNMSLTFFKIMTTLSGEFTYYRNQRNSRQVCDESESDKVWFDKIKKAARDKIEGTYYIDPSKLDVLNKSH